MPNTSLGATALQFVSTERLAEIHAHLIAKSHFQRGANGFEVPTYVLPITPAEAQSIINEITARRRAHGRP
jgi:hypothetical protein